MSVLNKFNMEEKNLNIIPKPKKNKIIKIIIMNTFKDKTFSPICFVRRFQA